MMASLSIGICHWIRVYLRSCLSSKMPKQGFPCIGLEIGLGHILGDISFLDIDMMASLSIGIWNWIRYIGGQAYVQRCRNRGFHVLDWKLDWVISYVLIISRYWYHGKPKYWDLELDWGISEALPFFEGAETGMSIYWIGNWIRPYPTCYFIYRYWYDGKP